MLPSNSSQDIYIFLTMSRTKLRFAHNTSSEIKRFNLNLNISQTFKSQIMKTILFFNEDHNYFSALHSI